MVLLQKRQYLDQSKPYISMTLYILTEKNMKKNSYYIAKFEVVGKCKVLSK